MIAALFDMDNTLLRVDTGMSWTKFLYRRGELPRSMLAKAMYWATLYKLASKSTPPEIAQVVVERAEAGEVVAAAEIRDMLDQARHDRASLDHRGLGKRRHPRAENRDLPIS